MSRNVYGSSLLWHLCIETSEQVCPGALEGRIVWGVNRKPKTLSGARGNIMAALGHLGMLTAQTCPTGLLHEVEHVLQVRLAHASLAIVCFPASHFVSFPFHTTAHHPAVVPFLTGKALSHLLHLPHPPTSVTESSYIDQHGSSVLAHTQITRPNAP